MEFNKENILNKVKAATQTTVVMDEGLRTYMLKVYKLYGNRSFYLQELLLLFLFNYQLKQIL